MRILEFRTSYSYTPTYPTPIEHVDFIDCRTVYIDPFNYPTMISMLDGERGHLLYMINGVWQERGYDLFPGYVIYNDSDTLIRAHVYTIDPILELEPVEIPPKTPIYVVDYFPNFRNQLRNISYLWLFEAEKETEGRLYFLYFLYRFNRWRYEALGDDKLNIYVGNPPLSYRLDFKVVNRDIIMPQSIPIKLAYENYNQIININTSESGLATRRAVLSYYMIESTNMLMLGRGWREKMFYLPKILEEELNILTRVRLWGRISSEALRYLRTATILVVDYYAPNVRLRVPI